MYQRGFPTLARQVKKPMARLKKSTLDGNVETMLLALLAEGPSYGYQIVRDLNQQGSGLLKLGEGTVYPVLHRLEERGQIAGKWRQLQGARPRKYYRLTPKGRRALAGQREQWAGLVEVMQKMLDGDQARPPVSQGGVA